MNVSRDGVEFDYLMLGCVGGIESGEELVYDVGDYLVKCNEEDVCCDKLVVMGCWCYFSNVEWYYEVGCVDCCINDVVFNDYVGDGGVDGLEDGFYDEEEIGV